MKNTIAHRAGDGRFKKAPSGHSRKTRPLGSTIVDAGTSGKELKTIRRQMAKGPAGNNTSELADQGGALEIKTTLDSEDPGNGQPQT
jgi:hypothetical protein